LQEKYIAFHSIKEKALRQREYGDYLQAEKKKDSGKDEP
jgi:hypothetical protein